MSDDRVLGATKSAKGEGCGGWMGQLNKGIINGITVICVFFNHWQHIQSFSYEDVLCIYNIRS